MDLISFNFVNLKGPEMVLYEIIGGNDDDDDC